jgi:phage tail-like protein
MPQQLVFRLHITGPEMEQDFIIPPGETLIGREPSLGLPLIFPLVSRRHARLDCDAGACTITDLGSANGTLVGGARLNPNEPQPLVDGMTIGIGPFEITCSVQEAASAEASAEEPAAEMPAAEMPSIEIPVVDAPPVKVSKDQEQPAKPAPSARKLAQASAEEPKKPSRQPRQKAAAVSPPEAPPPVPPTASPQEISLPEKPQAIPGLSQHSQRLINYLPGIYATDFVSRFLGMFESIFVPIEWNVDNFDMYLDPGTSPLEFLPWLANWYEIVFNASWTESQRRTLLGEAHQIYARRGTRWALSRLIEIYTGAAPEIVEFTDPKDPFTFTLKLPIRARDVDRQLLEGLIDSSKPAHASYILEFRNE